MIADDEPLLVACSGGGDSTALLAMLAPIARSQRRRLVAAIVDHALRDGSAADAARAGVVATSLGAEVVVERVAWPDGPRTAQAAARTARYAALARIARAVGARTLFLGHTRDDQAETLLIRRAAGSGPRGLAGMAALTPCPVWPEGRDLMLARPLLLQRRDALRALLHEQGICWLEDPANTLARFARVRARAALARDPSAADELLAAADRRAIEAAREDGDALAWLAVHARFAEDTVVLDRNALIEPGALRAVGALAAAIGGATREPSPEKTARLAPRLAAGAPATLGGSQFGAGDQIVVSRDPGGVFGRRGGGAGVGPLALPAGEPVVWDGRLELLADAAGWVALPPARGQRLAPSLSNPAAAGGGVGLRWLVRDRVDRLLWRGNCTLFTGP